MTKQSPQRPLNEAAEYPSSKKPALLALDFDPDHYRGYLDEFELTEQQENELL